MHIFYEEGPPKVTMGAAGTFKRGESRDIDDKLAEQILGKKTIVFKKGKKIPPDPPLSKGGDVGAPLAAPDSPANGKEVANG